MEATKKEAHEEKIIRKLLSRYNNCTNGLCFMIKQKPIMRNCWDVCWLMWWAIMWSCWKQKQIELDSQSGVECVTCDWCGNELEKEKLKSPSDTCSMFMFSLSIVMKSLYPQKLQSLIKLFGVHSRPLHTLFKLLIVIGYCFISLISSMYEMWSDIGSSVFAMNLCSNCSRS